ncbi:S8 family peptidase [Thermoactinospora rubra]|uniref:S8 family peptidase n=1 Tax=Thermoactinospora rubra TaxID=1088767 RepID=UPI000A10C430|nr:S8 family serine peptidase [Thermoactinospora rubra]
MGRLGRGLAAMAVGAALLSCAPATPPAAAEYLVFYAAGARADALKAVRAAGGTAVATEPKLGYIVAAGRRDGFAEALGASPAIAGVSSDRPIGYASARTLDALPDAATLAGKPGDAKPGASGEPLAHRQWDMRMIGADRAHALAPGTKQVLVGVIDTGVDGDHPDIAPNFNRELSRNFVTDIPKDPRGQVVDGPCEHKGCKDPADVDDDGHGTHVASTIAAPVNGLGIAGVAPGVQIVNLRAGQDSGLFFLKPSLQALTYAADIGVDVVNMSYYVDPWMFNCADNPADNPRERQEQRAVITGMQRAIDYARSKGVTLITALGNDSLDLGHPVTDHVSPNYPRGVAAKSRKLDNSCLNVPAESKGVVSVAAVGPSGSLAGYSNYGLEQTDLAAPGGDVTDGEGMAVGGAILAAAPEDVLRRKRKIRPSGEPATSQIVRDCRGGTCAYYQYMEGTSMAAPHAAGVAAILISRFGKPGPGGLHLAPAEVERLLYATATPKGCPSSSECRGDRKHNGFYGRGIVDAFKAATVKL